MVETDSKKTEIEIIKCKYVTVKYPNKLNAVKELSWC
jgi:hypothetical protein